GNSARGGSETPGESPRRRGPPSRRAGPRRRGARPPPVPAAPAAMRSRPSPALSPRFEHGYERVEDRGDRHDEGDIGEHPRHLHAFGEMNDAVAESGERGDGLAADDGEKRDGKSHAHPGQAD